MKIKHRAQPRESVSRGQRPAVIAIFVKDEEVIERQRRLAAQDGRDWLVGALNRFLESTDAVYFVLWSNYKNCGIEFVHSVSEDGLLDSEDLLELALRYILQRAHEGQWNSEVFAADLSIHGPPRLATRALSVAHRLGVLVSLRADGTIRKRRRGH